MNIWRPKDDITNLRLELEQSVNKLLANFDALKWVITLAMAGTAILLTVIQIILALVLRG